MRNRADHALIDFRNPESWQLRRPILTAHRGGVVDAASPENSRLAIQRAAADGFDMVELDVSVAGDGEPVLFHDVDGTLRGTSAAGLRLGSLPAHKLIAVRYDGSAETILSLDEGLALCRSLGLGVMLDIKIELDQSGGRSLVERIGSLVTAYGLAAATMTISAHPLASEILAADILTPVSDSELARLGAGQNLQLAGRFWFGVPRQLDESLIEPLHRASALVVPAINIFRYRAGSGDPRARDDIRRLLGRDVDGFQIDSVFQDAFAPGS